ncbi:GNAT family N-acetyltransferase [Marivita sp.]|uniref:GNAT family N-acetyltransferase n=1 Tax=Marivita sp. TaxID=2003365 RepID=UPI003F6D7785
MHTLTKDDIPDILPLFRALHRHHVAALPDRFHDDGTDSQFADHLAQLFDSDGAALGVRVDGALVAYALFVIQNRAADAFRHSVRRGYLEHIFVAEVHRKAGHATAMIAAMEARIVGQGIPVWTATHYPFNSRIAGAFSAVGANVDLIRVSKPVDGVQ